MRGNSDQKPSRDIKDFIKTIFGIVDLDRTDVGNPDLEEMLPSYLTPLNAAFRKTSYRMGYDACLPGPQDSPLFSLLSTCNSCFANTMKHTHPAGRRGRASADKAQAPPLPAALRSTSFSRSAQQVVVFSSAQRCLAAEARSSPHRTAQI